MAEPTVPIIPLEHFFENPEKAGVQISPDGTRLSYLAPEEGRLNVWVQTIGEDDAVCVTHDHERGIPGYLWSRDGSRIIYVQDQGGNENYRIYVADPAAPDAPGRDLTPFDDVRCTLVDNPKATPTKLLIAMNKRHPALFDVHRLDIVSGDIEDVAENPGDVAAWIPDAEGRLRAALAQLPDGGWQLRVRDSEDADWRALADFTNEDDCTPYAFTPDGTGLWIGTAKDAEFQRLCRIDVATGELTTIDEHPEGDLAAAVVSDKTRELVGAAYLLDEVVFHALEPSWEQTWQQLKALHHGDPSITGMDDDERTMIVTFNDDRDPGVVYSFNRETGESHELFRMRPWLNPEHLAPMAPVSFPARDGLTLHAYLTTPVGVEVKGLPMVLLVHGGPWARDAWGYDPEAQFLANRGYAVLQVNYRGSTGYGKSFRAAAIKEFAGKMHDDLIDAVEWAVDQAVANREKIAIYGGSYGGYATLVGMTFTPDVFCCGISYVGPSSLITLIESFPEYWKPFMAGTWFKYVGDPEDPEQRKDLEARSPLFKVDNIKSPLMVVQGANDPRVTKVESDQIVEALRKKGIEVEYIVAEDEGHGFANPENKLRLYRAMETFFAEHLGGRTA